MIHESIGQAKAVRFFVRGPLPGLNEIIEACKGCGGKGYGYARMKKVWTQNVAWSAKAAMVGKATTYRLDLLWVGPVHGNKAEMDRDNRESFVKFINDGLKAAKITPDDKPDYYLGSTHNHMQGSKPGVWVTVIDASTSDCIHHVPTPLLVVPAERADGRYRGQNREE